MAGVMKNLGRWARVVSETFRRKRDLVRPFCAREAFACKSVPHGLVEQARGVLPGNNGVAEMKVVAMRRGKLSDDNVPIGSLRGGTGNTSHRLQERERTKLQRVQLQGILPRGHDIASYEDFPYSTE
jgi:hypothetical protein